MKLITTLLTILALATTLPAAQKSNASQAKGKAQQAKSKQPAKPANAKQANASQGKPNAKAQSAKPQDKSQPNGKQPQGKDNAKQPQQDLSKPLLGPNGKPLPTKLPPMPVNSDKDSWGIKSGFFGGVGVGAGMMLFTTPSMNKGNRCSAGQSCSAMDSVLAVDYSAKVGYQHYFTFHQGLRIYASYTGGSGFPAGGSDGNGNTSTLYYMNNSAYLNVDYLLELAQTKHQAFGVHLGLYGGYQNFWRSQTGTYTIKGSGSSSGGGGNTQVKEGDATIGGFGAGVNVGISYTWMRHHRFDITAKIPVLALYNLGGNDGIYRGNMWVDNTGYGNAWTQDIYYWYASLNVSYSFIF